jgi:hypothetical protein
MSQGWQQRCACPACFNQSGVLRLDKRGRPYVKCMFCLSTTFVGDPSRGIAFLSVLTPDLAAKLRRVSEDADPWQAPAPAVKEASNG